MTKPTWWDKPVTTMTEAEIEDMIQQIREISRKLGPSVEIDIVRKDAT